jgi:hypothetical protein
MRVPLTRRFGLLATAGISLAATVAGGLPGAHSAPTYPSIGTLGVSFSASTPTDPQRDVGEPEIHIDRAGKIYTCGPSGFSNVADYMQVSTDGGDQFHLLGEPPRGQISSGEGGGDCGLATGTEPNAEGDYTLAYSGLGPLTNFSTFTSPDGGHTINGSPISESPPGVDRQWHVFTGKDTVYFNYNHLVNGYTVQKSTDGGLTYGTAVETGASGGRIGPMRAVLSPDNDPDKAIVYFPSYKGSTITVTRSMDGGATWGTCNVIDAEFSPSAGFVIADNDTAGNVYITYAEKGGDHDTWMTILPAAQLSACEANDDLGIGKQYRVNRDKVETTVMPWIVAGEPGKVAIAFFGTESVGDPDDGAFVASWYPYVSMSLDVLSANPHFGQVKATTHPFHYGSICLGGLGCDTSVPEGDRSLADYFAMDISPITGRLHIVYGSAAKKPTDAVGHISTATVVNQETGPSLLPFTLTARRPIVRADTTDPEGDALSPYSQLDRTPDPQNVDALDILDVKVEPEVDLETGDPVDEGGVTVTIKVKDLGDAALQDALLSTGEPHLSLVYLFRFLNGFQPAGATAAWNPATGFTFGFDDFTTKSTESGQADPTSEKIIVWPQATAIDGEANQDSGLIRLNIPRSVLKAQSGPTGKDQVPTLVDATDGSRFFDGTAFAMSNPVSPVQALQSYLYQIDSSASMDFVVGKLGQTPTKGGKKDDEGKDDGKTGGTKDDNDDAAGPATTPTTGLPWGLGLGATVLLGAGVAVVATRRRVA